MVNEDEYSDIVRKRQEEDWVIDDGMEIPFVVLWPMKLVLWDQMSVDTLN